MRRSVGRSRLAQDSSGDQAVDRRPQAEGRREDVRPQSTDTAFGFSVSQYCLGG